MSAATVTDTATHIEASNVGAVRRFGFDLEAPGVTVIRGANGSGKSTILDGVHSAATGAGSLPLRDGAKSGSLEVGGVTLKVGRRSTRREGEFDLVSIEDRLGIDTLVEPGVKDPEAADGRRIKALIALLGVEADPAVFEKAIGSLEGLDVDTDTDDPLELAGRYRKALQAAARGAERVADRESGRASELAAQFADVDLEAESDEEKLRAAYDEALSEAAAIADRRLRAVRGKAAADKARGELETLEAKAAELGSVEDLREASDAAMSAMLRAGDDVEEIKAKLAEAQERQRLAASSYREAETKLEAAGVVATSIETARETLSAAEVDPVTDEEIEAANKRKREAAEAVETGVSVRAAKRASEAAGVAEAAAAAALRDADRFRQDAAEVDLVLSKLIDCDSLAVKIVDTRTRLVVTDHERGADVPFADLSEGERFRVVLGLAAARVGEGGLVVVPQEAWEPLDVQTRSELAEHARELGVYVLTAEAEQDPEQSGELRVESFAAGE